MTIRSSRIFLPLLVIAGAAMLGGCGVKNDPVAPSGRSSADGAGVAASGGVSASSGFGTTGSTSPSMRVSRIQDDTNIAPAEVSRNAGASRSSFILDPLLN